MSKLPFFSSLFISVIFFVTVCNGQTGTITSFDTASGLGGLVADASGNVYYNTIYTVYKISPSGVTTIIAGNGIAGYSGDGGPATAALFNFINDVGIDTSGNIYLTDDNNKRVRKISSSGIVTTIAGTGIYGYSGDGGPATAAKIGYIKCVAIDPKGNIYLTDAGHVVRKINSAGIISTVAGNGTPGFSGDGDLATAALLNDPEGVTLDGQGNIYVSDLGNKRIRKIDTSGIITTIAGNGIAGYTGDGGIATNAEINMSYYIKADLANNIFISEQNNYVVRKISPSGIITTVAGNGSTGYSGDGGPATAASLSQMFGIAFDAHHNLFIMNGGTHHIRKVALLPNISADSFSVFIDYLCGGIQLSAVTKYQSASSLITFFGDGTQETDTFSVGVLHEKYVNLVHNYSAPGTYTIKEFLFDGSTKIDSAFFSYQYLTCQSFAMNFYFDSNGDCVKNGTEPFIELPVTTEIDSNGVAIDTISTTSGFYYTAYGNAGDIYSFKILSAPAGLIYPCNPGGVLSDTLDSTTHNVKTEYIGFYCSSATDFDLVENVNLISGRHLAIGNIIAYNSYCPPINATITMNINPKYVFESAVPTPSAISGNTVVWDYASLTAYSPEPHIQFRLTVLGTWLTPCDTLLSTYSITPSTGDIDPSNNNCVRIDTVKSSFDPNEMSVTPAGNITPGTNLEYTIEFENTGNDTAQNIYVMDTLSDNVDVASLRVIGASAVMNIATFQYSGHNIIKFDFPGIKLLDSSHHNQCDGMVVFTVNAKTGLAPGTTIFNRAGIFFDDNPVVMTNTVEDIIPIPTNITALNVPSKFSVYPNPASDELTLRIANTSSQHRDERCTITNTIGQLFIQQALTSAQTTLNIKSLPAGLYYVTFYGTSGSSVQKFIKK